MQNTARNTGATMDTAVRKPVVTKRPWRTEGEPFDPSKVSTSMSVTAARMVLDERARYDDLLDSVNWAEYALVTGEHDCGFGCKVYRNKRTGALRIDHHGVYGCPRGGERINL